MEQTFLSLDLNGHRCGTEEGLHRVARKTSGVSHRGSLCFYEMLKLLSLNASLVLEHSTL